VSDTPRLFLSVAIEFARSDNTTGGLMTRRALLTLADEVELLQRENAALRADKERLDRLEAETKSSQSGVSFDYARHVENGIVVEKGFRFMRHHYLGERKNDLRSAIDAVPAKEGILPQPTDKRVFASLTLDALSDASFEAKEGGAS